MRAFFHQRPELRAALVALVDTAHDFEFDDRRLFVRWREELSASALSQLCYLLDAVGRMMIEAPKDLPYR